MMTPLPASLSVAKLALSTGATRLKSEMGTLSRTLSNGAPADLTRHLRADLTPFSRLVTAFRMANAAADLARGTGQRLELQSVVIDNVTDRMLELRHQASLTNQGEDKPALDSQAFSFAASFDELVSNLNQSGPFGPLFTGINGTSPLVSSGQMAAAVTAGIDASMAADAIVQHVNTWFAPGGAFDTFAYLGGPAAKILVPAGDTYTELVAPSADQNAFRDLLATVFLGGIGRHVPGMPAETSHSLTQRAGDELSHRIDGIQALRRGLAVQQEHVERARLRAMAEAEALDLHRAAFVDIDPYATASRLQENLQQTELIFTLTARLSRLNLAEYLR